MALENKLERSLATRIVFSTEDTQFIVQVLREITFSIEVTTVTYLCFLKSFVISETANNVPVRYDIE